MRRWAVIVETPAQQDIETVYLLTAERDSDAADRWFNRIYETIGSLELFPERCPLAPESRFLDQQIREAFHGRRQYKYRILFTVTEREVHILHVGHAARLRLGETGQGRSKSLASSKQAQSRTSTLFLESLLSSIFASEVFGFLRHLVVLQSASGSTPILLPPQIQQPLVQLEEFPLQRFHPLFQCLRHDISMSNSPCAASYFD